MPVISTRFCHTGHSRWPLLLVKTGAELHYLCHPKFVGKCTSGEHTTLCDAHFHGCAFALPPVHHAPAVAHVLGSASRSDASREAHDYVAAVFKRFPYAEAAEHVLCIPALVPHVRLLRAHGAIRTPASPREHRLFLEAGLDPGGAMVTSALCSDAIAVHSYRQWLAGGSVASAQVPLLAAVVVKVLAALPPELRDHVWRYIFYTGGA
jgi:hypothetical protein